MVDWSNGYGARARFLMLCVETGEDGLRTARSFGQQFEVPAAVVNGYIDSPSEVPKYGQLGCGGFIVLGPHGEFVATRTAPAYLQKGPQAFTEVERLLSSLGVQQAKSVALPTAVKPLDVTLRLAPVGNEQMDEEHAALVVAAADLKQNRSVAALCSLRDLWAQHSAHEEALFEQHQFGGTQSGGLSGIASHLEHHRAIADMLDRTVQSNWNWSGAGLVDQEAVQEIIAEMQRHGDVYDSAYAGKLSM